MSLRVEYHELVDLDLTKAWHWYEDQEEGLGDRVRRRRPRNRRPGVAMAQRRGPSDLTVG